MNEKNTNLEILVRTAIEKIKEMVDVETIIGKPIVTGNGTTIIPVSKVSVGFGSGGSDLPTKQSAQYFGGGAGGGVSIQPIAFIVIMPDGNVRLLQLTVNASKENAALAILPEIVDKVSAIISQKKSDGSASAEDTAE